MKKLHLLLMLMILAAPALLGAEGETVDGDAVVRQAGDAQESMYAFEGTRVKFRVTVENIYLGFDGFPASGLYGTDPEAPVYTTCHFSPDYVDMEKILAALATKQEVTLAGAVRNSEHAFELMDCGLE
jgi:hypothetical protein